jgi:hypothetical protein
MLRLRLIRERNRCAGEIENMNKGIPMKKYALLVSCALLLAGCQRNGDDTTDTGGTGTSTGTGSYGTSGSSDTTGISSTNQSGALTNRPSGSTTSTNNTNNVTPPTPNSSSGTTP